MFTALYYLSPKGGFYLKGGAGFAGRSAETEFRVESVTTTIREDHGGIGLGAGLGYDIQLARNFFLTPALDFVYTGTEGDGASLLLFTVGATWHQGERSSRRSLPVQAGAPSRPNGRPVSVVHQRDGQPIQTHGRWREASVRSGGGGA